MTASSSLVVSLRLQRGLEPGDVLVLRLGDVGQRLAVLQLLAQLGLGQTQIVGSALEAEAEPEAAMAEARAAGADRAGPRLAAEDTRPAEKARPAVREPLLGRLALLLGERAGGDRRVDPRLRRALDRGVELIAGHVQPFGDVVEEGLLFGGVIGGPLRNLRRAGGRGVRATGPGEDRETGRTHRELALGGDGHALKSTGGPQEKRKNADSLQARTGR